MSLNPAEKILEIRSLVSAIEKRHGIRVMAAVEGGSRAHGFASPGSDHDIRFIFRLPPERQFSLVEERDHLILKQRDLPFDPGFEIEFHGVTVKKALSMAVASKPEISEYIRRAATMGVINHGYAGDDDFIRSMLDLTSSLQPRPAAHNFRGLAKSNHFRDAEGDGTPMLKTYLHSARALMLSRWIVQNHDRASEYPLDFDDLVAETGLPMEVARILAQVLEWKRNALDSKFRHRMKVLDDWVASEIEILERIIPSIPEYPMVDSVQATEILLDCYGINLKSDFDRTLQSEMF